MRKYLNIDLNKRSVTTDELEGEEVIQAGRYLIAKTLLERGVAKVDPLSPENPLIFSAGPFAGTNFSNANRLSVGCKSPLTGGIKEPTRAGPSPSPSASSRSPGSRSMARPTTGSSSASRKKGTSPLRAPSPISARATWKSPRCCSRSTARR